MTDTPHDSDVAFIRSLAELLRDNDLTELRVKRDYGEDDALDVHISRVQPQAPAPVAQPAPVQVAAPAAPQAAPAADTAPADPASDPGAVTSPMVGTCYLSPEPDAKPFVSVGDAVTEGQTILIVEAMKTMNHIPAPRSGVVRQILVEDGAPVEYGAPLVILG
ncbi:acetyl-CoA carboxylase biotin carboxyl carrier protein [Palleronia sediminis]|uniref:Biotin carboxyl carrier protein of acetyl-CoA carboxylase n=1 Tax=Palleronia sediminis TaxID=2547833 RepID=A0A4R6AE22_9RHOB|nr:acetyl-CoA carboxylase biotin carboxyl carrier protein [Palleronia sediminis]TDL79706.1 acetyl-CoA carboxylase biotin carboxyl carrier protein [Palleronia sediminis]